MRCWKITAMFDGLIEVSAELHVARENYHSTEILRSGIRFDPYSSNTKKNNIILFLKTQPSHLNLKTTIISKVKKKSKELICGFVRN